MEVINKQAWKCADYAAKYQLVWDWLISQQNPRQVAHDFIIGNYQFATKGGGWVSANDSIPSQQSLCDPTMEILIMWIMDLIDGGATVN